jgi:hypothetical protein
MFTEEVIKEGFLLLIYFAIRVVLKPITGQLIYICKAHCYLVVRIFCNITLLSRQKSSIRSWIKLYEFLAAQNHIQLKS